MANILSKFSLLGIFYFWGLYNKPFTVVISIESLNTSVFISASHLQPSLIFTG